MRPLEELHIITPDTQVLDALKLMAGNDVNQLPVVANGTLQGIVSRSHLMQLLQTRSELQHPTARYAPLHRIKQKGVTQ
jgi:CBS domain-containing protein